GRPPATPIIPIRGDERTQTLVPGEPPCPGRTALNGQYSSTYDAVPARTPPGHRRGDPRSPGRRPVPLAGGRRLRGDRGVARRPGQAVPQGRRRPAGAGRAAPAARGTARRGQRRRPRVAGRAAVLHAPHRGPGAPGPL